MLQTNSVRILGMAMLACGLAGCDRYIDRRDQLTFGGGDAVAANKAAQIIDPWPAAARTIDHGMSGEQAEMAMARMRRPAEQKPASTGAAPGNAPAAPAAPSATLR